MVFVLLYSILGGVFLLILLLLLTPLDVGADILHEAGQSSCKLHFRILGIPIVIKVPLAKEEKKAEKAADKEVKKAEKEFTPKRFIAFSKSLYRLYDEMKPDVKSLLAELREKVTCREIYFTIRYGTVNPARTGLLNGAIWTAGTLILRVLDSVLGVQKKTLEVYPDFQRAFMRIHMKLTFRFRPASMLCLGMKTLKLVKSIHHKLTTEF